MKRWTWILGIAAGGWALQRALRRPVVNLKNKVVIITGASAGIGLATAHAFAANGVRVVLVARNEARLQAAERDLAAYELETLIIPADITDPAAAERIVGATLDRFGRIDVLVNNAGRPLGGLVQEHDPARIRQAADVELYGAVRLTQEVLPVMLRQGRGYIVNVGSVIGRVPAPGLAVYSGIKAGIVGFSAALRREVDDYGLHVALVLPGPTRTHAGNAGDAPEFPAQAIVDAVRYTRREVITGGPAMRGAVWLERLAPWALDRYWRWVFTPQHIAEASRAGQ